MGQSPIAVAKTYQKSAIHVNTASGTFTEAWGTFSLTTGASGAITFTDSRGSAIDANWAHVQYLYRVQSANDSNKCLIAFEPSGAARTAVSDQRSRYDSLGLPALNTEGASGFPGIVLYPIGAATDDGNFIAKDEHTWHFPTGGITELRYTIMSPTAIKPVSNTHHFILITYGKEYPENVQTMLNGTAGDNWG